MTPATPPDLREALAPLASWLAARDGYGFDSELSPDEQQAYVGAAGTCLEQSGLAAFVMAALAKRDAANKRAENLEGAVGLEGSLEGIEWLRTSDIDRLQQAGAQRDAATARADALERAVTGLKEERERMRQFFARVAASPIYDSAAAFAEDEARAALAQQEKADV